MIDSIIRGDSKILCLLGNPVAHSISPQLHNHAFKTLGLNYVYIPLAVGSEVLGQTVFTLRSIKFAGANVTVPHKQQILNYCDRLSSLSTITGAVNTLYWKAGLLHGTTTDSIGFFRALTSIGFNFEKSSTVILGNGGTARTLATAIALDNKSDSLTLVGRNAGRVSQLAEQITMATSFNVQHATFDSPNLGEIMDSCTLLVNCTSVGMHPHINDTPLSENYFNKRMTVFDAIYNPVKTRFLIEAQAAGCRIENGLRMLLYQALASSELWTGIKIPESIYNPDSLSDLVLNK